MRRIGLIFCFTIVASCGGAGGGDRLAIQSAITSESPPPLRGCKATGAPRRGSQLTLQAAETSDRIVVLADGVPWCEDSLDEADDFLKGAAQPLLSPGPASSDPMPARSDNSAQGGGTGNSDPMPAK